MAGSLVTKFERKQDVLNIYQKSLSEPFRIENSRTLTLKKGGPSSHAPSYFGVKASDPELCGLFTNHM